MSNEIRIFNIIEDGRYAGPQKRILNVAKRLNKNSFNTTVVLPLSFELSLFKNKLAAEGVEYYEARLTTPHKGLLNIVKYLIRLPIEVMEIRRALVGNEVRVLHCSGGLWQVKGPLAGRLSKAKVVWHLNDTSMPKVVRIMGRFIARFCANHIVFAGKSVENYYCDIIPDSMERSIIPAPVDTCYYKNESTMKRPRFENGSVKILTVGHVNPVKNYELMVLAARELDDNGVDFEWTIVGEVFNTQYEYKAKLLDQIKLYNLESRVVFKEGISDPKRLLSTTDIYVCCSRAEASPTSVWEAMSMGVPVVSTSVGDVPVYISNNINGFVVDVGDHISMANGISILSRDSKLCEEYASRSIDVVRENMDIQVVARLHEELYERLLE